MAASHYDSPLLRAHQAALDAWCNERIELLERTKMSEFLDDYIVKLEEELDKLEEEIESFKEGAGYRLLEVIERLTVILERLERTLDKPPMQYFPPTNPNYYTPPYYSGLPSAALYNN